jgi:ATP-dependent protease ClpP protease subunit
MYIQFTIDPTADEPIMLLNKQIGATYDEQGNWDGTPYIDGSEFQAELLSLDNLGKKRIQVWVNSPGGSVMDGMSIYSAILKSETPVDTYNVGVAASIAGAIFMAGRKRYMADYAQFMMHPVGGAEGKAKQAFTDSVAKMLSGKAGMDEDTVASYMAITSWIGAAEALMKGIATDIEYTKEANKKYMPTEVKAMLEYSNNILNQKINPKKMLEVTNKLNLAEGAAESDILAAINALEDARNQATNSLTEAQEKVTQLEAELASAKEALNEANEAAATEAATNMVNSFKARIGNDANVVNKWVNLAKNDMEGTKTILEALPLNVAAPATAANNVERTQPLTAAAVMAELQQKNQAKKN